MHDTSLLQRVERLELQNRRFRITFSVLGLALFLALATGLAPETDVADVLEASRFVLRGPGGEEACVLETDRNGFPHLLMRKDKSNAILTLNGPALLLRGPDGKRSAFMGIDTRGTTRLELTSERIIDGIKLVVKEDGSAGIYVLDQSGRDRMGLEASQDAGATLVLRDPEGRIRSSFGVDPHRVPSMILFDDVGRRRMGLLIDESNQPLMAVEDGRGNPRFEITTRFDGSALLRLRREDGGVAFQAP